MRPTPERLTTGLARGPSPRVSRVLWSGANDLRDDDSCRLIRLEIRFRSKKRHRQVAGKRRGLGELAISATVSRDLPCRPRGASGALTRPRGGGPYR